MPASSTAGVSGNSSIKRPILPGTEGVAGKKRAEPQQLKSTEQPDNGPLVGRSSSGEMSPLRATLSNAWSFLGRGFSQPTLENPDISSSSGLSKIESQVSYGKIKALKYLEENGQPKLALDCFISILSKDPETKKYAESMAVYYNALRSKNTEDMEEFIRNFNEDSLSPIPGTLPELFHQLTSTEIIRKDNEIDSLEPALPSITASSPVEVKAGALVLAGQGKKIAAIDFLIAGFEKFPESEFEAAFAKAFKSSVEKSSREEVIKFIEGFNIF